MEIKICNKFLSHILDSSWCMWESPTYVFTVEQSHMSCSTINFNSKKGSSIHRPLCPLHKPFPSSNKITLQRVGHPCSRGSKAFPIKVLGLLESCETRNLECPSEFETNNFFQNFSNPENISQKKLSVFSGFAENFSWFSHA